MGSVQPGVLRRSQRLSQARLMPGSFMQAVVPLVAAFACALCLSAVLPASLVRAQEAGEVSVEEHSIVNTDNDFIALPRMARAPEDRSEHDEFHKNVLDFATGDLSLIDQYSKDGSGRQLPAAMCYEGKLLPNLYLFGTPKAGSTTLWAYLVSPMAHNSVWCFPKEPKFLGLYREFWSSSTLAAEYGRYFPTCDKADNGTYYVMDGTPAYIHRDLAPLQILLIYGPELSKRLKFIATLRNPADRLLSFFNHYGRDSGNIPANAIFDKWVVEQLDATDLCFRAAGMHRSFPGDLPIAYRRCQRLNQIVQSWHAMQLFNWFNHFSPDQFMFVDFDNIDGNPSETVHKVFDFAGIPYDEHTFQPLVANNGSERERKKYVRQEEMLPSTREIIDEFFLPLNVQLRNLLVRTGHGDSVPAFASRAYDLFMSRKKSETQ